MSVAIVTVNWNRWQLTQRCIAAVRKNKTRDFHIYVVDNASTDGSVGHLTAMGADVTLIEHPRNSGWSGGNNVGIARALADGHEFVLLLNNDALLAPRALGVLMQAHADCIKQDGGPAPILGAIEARTNGTVGFVRAAIDPATGIPEWVTGINVANEPALMPTDFVFGAGLFAHHSVFRKVGRFDERFFLNFDETDWCFRAKRAGHRLLMARDAVIIHDGSGTIGGWNSPLNVYFYVRNRLLFAEKYCTEAQRRAVGRQQKSEEEHYDRTNGRLAVALRRGAEDYTARRFGDCPDLIRKLASPASAEGKAADKTPDPALRQLMFNANPGPHHERDSGGLRTGIDPAVRLIAYYLPQFHPIPENDEWWGKGFTEWTNVSKALPRFQGHYQPRLPGALGFYDLRLRENLQQQAELARRYGIHGFCFHHYWFSGTKLLDTPLRMLLESPDIDLPFCLNWANENWTRRWDGEEDHLLIAQRHSPEADIALCEDLLTAIRDPRYIRVDGRPLIMIYRPGLLPDAAATLERWRKHFKAAGESDPYLVMPQGFEDNDPRRYGFDAAAGFPPHRFGWHVPRRAPKHPFDPNYEGFIHRYDDMVAAATSAKDEGYTLLPGVAPAWDNEARRPNWGTCFVGSTPKKYGAWLEHACGQALRAEMQDERIVFINAWNEWAEGAYLEPDRHFGYAYLAETARALERISAAPNGARKADRKTSSAASAAVE